MKKIFILFVLSVALFSACKKEDKACTTTAPATVAPQNEIDAIKAYLAANSITATQHPTGYFYTITAPGTGNSPTLCNTVGVIYKGTLTSGKVFDDSKGQIVRFPLSSLIKAWQNAIPTLKTGGRMMLYIPPSLGYGPDAVRDPVTNDVVIPGNSILIFDITLNSFG